MMLSFDFGAVCFSSCSVWLFVFRSSSPSVSSGGGSCSFICGLANTLRLLCWFFLAFVFKRLSAGVSFLAAFCFVVSFSFVVVSSTIFKTIIDSSDELVGVASFACLAWLSFFVFLLLCYSIIGPR